METCLKIHRWCFAISSGIQNIYVSFDSNKLYLNLVFFTSLNRNLFLFELKDLAVAF
jgi:hypothetical protein